MAICGARAPARSLEQPYQGAHPYGCSMPLDDPSRSSDTISSPPYTKPLSRPHLPAAVPARSRVTRSSADTASCFSQPENAPEHCPGTESLDAGKAAACAGCPNQEACQSAPKGPDPDIPFIQDRMKGVRKKIVILSGKGGVGKSTFTTALGWALASDEDLQVCPSRVA